MPIPSNEFHLTIEYEHSVLHVFERDTHHFAAPLQFGGALLDDLFQLDGCVGAFREQLIQLHGVSPEYFDGSSHGADLVGPRHRNRAFSSARRNGQHRAAQTCEAGHDVAPDVEPGNQAVTERIAISGRRLAMAASIRKAHEELLEGITPAVDDANFELMTKSQGAENKAASNQAIESLRRLLEVQAEANLLAGLLIESSMVTEIVRLQPLREVIDAARGKIESNLKVLADPEQRKKLIGLYDQLAAMARRDGIIALRARELQRQHEAQLAFAATQTEAVKLKRAVDSLVEQQGKGAEAVSARAHQLSRPGPPWRRAARGDRLVFSAVRDRQAH